MSRILTAGINQISESLFNPVDYVREGYLDMFCMNKPNGCLWGSTYTPNEMNPSDWIDWISVEDFHTDKYKFGITYKLSRKAKVCTVDSYESYAKLMETYGLSRYPEELHKGGILSELVIDWNKLSKDFDAFHITRDAFWELRLPFEDLVDTLGRRIANFYSYDCESWIIFNLDCINKGSIQNISIDTKYYDDDED